MFYERKKIWKKLKFLNSISVLPPFVPHLSSLDDTSNFDEFERIKFQPHFDYQPSKEFTGKDLPFVGFTYVRQEEKSKRYLKTHC